jgi:calcineurin-like phosphoesterase family protein
MTEGLIERFNAIVKPDDVTYFLGDFAMGQKIRHQGYFDRLNGTKLLVRGNHDQSPAKMTAMGFKEVHTSIYMDINGLRVYMAHIPVGFDSYVGREYAPEFITTPPPDYDIFLCGHVHGAWKERRTDKGQRIINVGVDVWNYEPQTFEALTQNPI